MHEIPIRNLTGREKQEITRTGIDRAQHVLVVGFHSQGWLELIVGSRPTYVTKRARFGAMSDVALRIRFYQKLVIEGDLESPSIFSIVLLLSLIIRKLQ